MAESYYRGSSNSFTGGKPVTSPVITPAITQFEINKGKTPCKMDVYNNININNTQANAISAIKNSGIIDVVNNIGNLKTDKFKNSKIIFKATNLEVEENVPILETKVKITACVTGLISDPPHGSENPKVVDLIDSAKQRKVKSKETAVEKLVSGIITLTDADVEQLKNSLATFSQGYKWTIEVKHECCDQEMYVTFKDYDILNMNKLKDDLKLGNGKYSGILPKEATNIRVETVYFGKKRKMSNKRKSKKKAHKRRVSKKASRKTKIKSHKKLRKRRSRK